MRRYRLTTRVLRSGGGRRRRRSRQWTVLGATVATLWVAGSDSSWRPCEGGVRLGNYTNSGAKWWWITARLCPICEEPSGAADAIYEIHQRIHYDGRVVEHGRVRLTTRVFSTRGVRMRMVRHGACVIRSRDEVELASISQGGWGSDISPRLLPRACVALG